MENIKGSADSRGGKITNSEEDQVNEDQVYGDALGCVEVVLGDTADVPDDIYDAL